MRVVFFTGSGLSADSGIPTFRGRGGLYDGLAAEDVLSASTLRDRPGLVHRFLDDFRQSTAGARPNPAHALIAAWKRRFPDDTTVLTMNVDSLLEAAGCPDVVHLHGRLSWMRSLGNSHVTADIGHARYWDGAPETAPRATVHVNGKTVAAEGHQFRCPLTGALFRTDVVLFREIPPAYPAYRRALRGLGPNDALVVIGTQGNVVRICHETRDLPCLKILNNLHPADPVWIDERAWDKVIHRPAAEAAPAILSLLETWRAEMAPATPALPRRA